jgi:hypothetical protein
VPPARASFLRHVGGAAENEEGGLVLRWRHFGELQCHVGDSFDVFCCLLEIA